MSIWRSRSVKRIAHECLQEDTEVSWGLHQVKRTKNGGASSRSLDYQELSWGEYNDSSLHTLHKSHDYREHYLSTMPVMGEANGMTQEELAWDHTAENTPLIHDDSRRNPFMFR